MRAEISEKRLGVGRDCIWEGLWNIVITVTSVLNYAEWGQSNLHMEKTTLAAV